MLRKLIFGLLALALLVPVAAWAKIYYVNRGVKYHIGDGSATRSIDAQFLDAYPVVGPRWVQAFTVDREDMVQIRIDNIWGVDDCEYCKDMVYIDDHAMGRLTEANNHTPFSTLRPLAMHVEPGHVYVVRIVSEGSPGPIDDFAIEGVSVESVRADVQLLQPGPVMLQAQQPMPVFRLPAKVEEPCEGTKLLDRWLPEAERSRGILAWTSLADPVIRRMGADLAPGNFARIYLKVDASADGTAVGQFFEILLGDPETGWVITFAPGSTKPLLGNVKIKGRYRSGHFDLQDWSTGGWNELRVARCPDGQAHLWINGHDTGIPLSPSEDSQSFSLRSGGLKATVAEQPQQ